MVVFICIILHMYEETLERYAKIHRDQGGARGRKDISLGAKLLHA